MAGGAEVIPFQNPILAERVLNPQEPVFGIGILQARIHSADRGQSGDRPVARVQPDRDRGQRTVERKLVASAQFKQRLWTGGVENRGADRREIRRVAAWGVAPDPIWPPVEKHAQPPPERHLPPTPPIPRKAKAEGTTTHPIA